MSPGYITLGDNNSAMMTKGWEIYTSGLMSFHSGIVRPVQKEWVISISERNPWLGP